MEEINRILQDTVTQRVRFYKEVGEKIFRVKLDETVEASLITLGGFAEVGRSSLVLSTHESRILLDCGINTSSKDSVRSFPRFDITGFDLRKLQCPRLDCYVDLYDLKSSNNTMKFDIFSRKKFKCTICEEEFKTQLELTEQKHMKHGAKG